MDGSPSWYLDAVVARQKRDVHQRWVRTVIADRPCDAVLKTDIFEEAYGADSIYNDLFPGARLALGMDLNATTVHTAARRHGAAFRTMVSDVRHLPLRPGSVDVVVSMSTLDHFASREDIARSLDEIVRVLRPGGVLAITLDNPRNPTYHFVRWMTRFGWAPFELGETLSLSALRCMLSERGLRIEASAYLIHNPRGLSTMLFLTLRKALGRFANTPIRALLTIFAAFDKLPSRSITGCFVAVGAVKEGGCWDSIEKPLTTLGESGASHRSPATQPPEPETRQAGSVPGT